MMMRAKAIKRLHEKYRFWCRLSPIIDPAKISIHRYGHFGSYGWQGTRFYGFLTAEARDSFIKDHNAQRVGAADFDISVPTK